MIKASFIVTPSVHEAGGSSSDFVEAFLAFTIAR